MGFPDPAVSTGSMHQLLFALSNIVCAVARAKLLCLQESHPLLLRLRELPQRTLQKVRYARSFTLCSNAEVYGNTPPSGTNYARLEIPSGNCGLKWNCNAFRTIPIVHNFRRLSR